MKTLALLLALLLTACASNDGFVGGDEVENCQPGSDIELQIGTGDTSVMPDGRVIVMVEVANNADHAFTVESVRVDPLPQTGQSRQEVQGGSRAFGREVPEGEDATFEVPITVRMGQPLDRVNQSGVTVGVQVAVTVKLTDGNAARCQFFLPVRF
jgi:YbbR domain-containing protein